MQDATQIQNNFKSTFEHGQKINDQCSTRIVFDAGQTHHFFIEYTTKYSMKLTTHLEYLDLETMKNNR